jgi:hypothetical protein
MGKTKAWSFNSVRLPVLQDALQSEGLDWRACNHVAATSSLSTAIRSTGAHALAINSLTDVIVMAGLSEQRRVSIDTFPELDFSDEISVKTYDRRLLRWSHKVQGVRSRLFIEMQQRIRDYLETSSVSPPIQRVLRKGRRDLLASLQSLISAGVNPENLVCIEDVAIASTEVWLDLEQTFPDVCAIRDDLWINPDDFRRGTSKQAKDLKKRILASLDQAFGPCEGTRTIVHHGFYFYTAPQWALFQLIREIDDIDQIFIVHDDGRSPVYEIWRWYFTAKWNMPQLEDKGGAVDLKPPAVAFMKALRGETVDVAPLNGLLNVAEFPTPARFVRAWLEDVEALAAVDKDTKVKLFAAESDVINRHIGRFAGFTQDADVDLALLPLGAYLYGLHKCVTLSSDDKVIVKLDAETLRDIVASGYLLKSDGATVNSNLVPALMRALPFFEDCVFGEDWLKRASDLHKLHVAEVSHLGGRTLGENTLERMYRVVSNPISLAPWVDITPEDALDIQQAIEAVIQFATNVASKEKVKLNQHLGTLKNEILRGMAFLSPSTRERIEEIMNGMTIVNDTEVSVDDLLEIVGLILAPPVDFRDEDRRSRGGVELVGDLNQLDVLGLIRHDGPLHIANLSDLVFPGSVRAVYWPFTLDDLQRSPEAVDPVTCEILQTRQSTASLAALYLTSLALDGVEGQHWTKLSYIKAGEREEQNQSPILALVTSFSKNEVKSDAIRQRAGGVELKKIDYGSIGNKTKTRRKPRPPRSSDDTITKSMKKSGSIPVASALVCPRRFAMQWVAGPSPSYQAEHHQIMLYGNLLGRQTKLTRLINDLWRHVTKGQRASSEAKAVVKSGGAELPWLFTLSGSKNGVNAISLAYQSALNSKSPTVDLVAPKSSDFLPPAHEDLGDDLCTSCPVKSRCAVWHEPES